MKKMTSKAKMTSGSKVATSSLTKRDSGAKRAGRGAYKVGSVNKL